MRMRSGICIHLSGNQDDDEWTWEYMENDVGNDDEINWSQISEELHTVLDQTIDEYSVAKTYMRQMEGQCFKAWR